jgi:hypothetical protein
MNRFSPCAARLVLVASFTALTCGALPAETLREVLRAQKAPGAGQSLPNLDKTITSYQVLDDAKNFLIAYYVNDGSGTLDGPLVVSRFDKPAQIWQTKELSSAVLRNDSCLGSATGAQSVGDRIYLELHINPSASCTLVLSRDLAVQKVLSGWFLAPFADGRVVYHGNEIHFAPVHAAELSLYDPRTNQESKIYPRKPFQSVRAAHIEKMLGFYAHNPDWCNTHNNPCDPEWFDNDIQGDVSVSDKTDSLAFVVQFDNTNYWTDKERARLEAFRETRNHLKEHPDAAPDSAPDALLLYFFSDLGRIGRLNMKQAVLDLFVSSPELHDFLAAAFEAKEAAPERFQDFTAKFGPRWGNEPLRKQFLQGIETPPEFTSVLYVYRNLAHPDAIEYRELSPSDWKARYGGAPPAKALEADTLQQIFEH